ncbi:HNH endonuclease [Sulfurimonas sp. NW9]|uniref:HNH endonuclease n=1 Tax=Sulfurimonas sp. NW9 TaxID=2922728 RepID=UPI003DA941C6
MALIINKIYSQQDIKDELSCTVMRGMNYKKDTNRLVLIRNHVKSIYEDKQEGDILYYTGEGRKGNQTLTGANRRLLKSKQSNTTVFLFEVFAKTEYTYKGEVELINEPFIERQPDEDDNFRNVYVFPLKLKDRIAALNDQEALQNIEKKKYNKVKRLTDAEVYDKAKQTEQSTPGYSYTKAKCYQRSAYVVEVVLRRAQGICELCDLEAPFKKKDGTPYLEVHHIKQLAKGGPDTTDNAVALCPNCHRKMHTLSLPSDIKKLNMIANPKKYNI